MKAREVQRVTFERLAHDYAENNTVVAVEVNHLCGFIELVVLGGSKLIPEGASAPCEGVHTIQNAYVENNS